MIRLENLSFQYESSDGKSEQLKNISLKIKSGEFVLLTGRSGCGKTTITRILNGLCPQFYPGKVTGTYYLDGRNAKDIPINEIGSIVGSVFQDPRSQFFTSNVTDEIVLGMENNAMPRDEMEERLLEMRSQLGIDPLLGKSLFPLSSGEKQRVAIASVCAMHPRVLVLDEPSANLDSDTIEQLRVLLTRLKEAGTTIVLSEHRLHYARDIFDRMVLIEDGTIYKDYSAKEALALTDEQLNNLGLRHFTPPQITPGKRISYNEDAFLCAQQLSLSFGGQRILDDVELCAEKGKILAITGENGAGKSSLCSVLTGIYKQNVGQVLIKELPMKKKQRILSTFFVQQDSDYQLYAASVEDEFYIGTKMKNLTKEKVSDLLHEVGLDNLSERHPLSLSGGQKQRLLLALAIASGKEILVLDEPTSGLDGGNMRMLADLLKRLAAKGKCIILITHDLELIQGTADRLIYMSKSKITYHRVLANT